MAEPEPDILAPLRAEPKKPSVPGPHPRDLQMQEAGEELFGLTKEWSDRHGLSQWEFHYLLATLQRGHLQAACLAMRGV